MTLPEMQTALWHNLLAVHHQVLQALETDLQTEADLSLTWYEVLNALSTTCDEPDQTAAMTPKNNPLNNPLKRGRLRLQDLAEAIALSQSGLTRLLDRLEEASLVERRPCPQDRRGAYAVITETGQARLAQARPIYQASLERHLGQHLTQDDIETLSQILSQILEEPQ